MPPKAYIASVNNRETSMSDVNFADHIASERERLSQERDRLQGNRANIDAQLADLDREFAAIDAYEQAKTGKTAPVSNGATRARRGSRRESIINALSQSPGGLTRGELLTLHGVKGDKSGEMSVSNALTALVKAGQLVREGGKYCVPATPLRAAAE